VGGADPQSRTGQLPPAIGGQGEGRVSDIFRNLRPKRLHQRSVLWAKTANDSEPGWAVLKPTPPTTWPRM